jgi:hypothetical protein
MGSAVINCSVNRCSPVEIHYPSAPNGISSRSCKKSTPLPPSSAPHACVLRPNLLRFPARLPHPAPTSAAVPATPTAEATPLLRRSRLFFRDQALHPYFITRKQSFFKKQAVLGQSGEPPCTRGTGEHWQHLTTECLSAVLHGKLNLRPRNESSADSGDPHGDPVLCFP